MSNNSIQHIRGTLAEHSTYTGRKGEISLITDSTNDRVPTGEVRIHDGATAGGVPIRLGTSSSPLTSDIYLASGSGINFDAYATSGNPSSNLLDDYEEGTFQITVSGSTSGSTTYTSSTQVGGKYTKIGNLVYCEITINNKTFPTFSGTLKIDMPFIKDGSFEFESRSGDVYWYPSSKWDSTTNHTGFAASMYASQSYNVLGIKAVDSDRQTAVTSTNTPNLPGASGIYLRYSISYITS